MTISFSQEFRRVLPWRPGLALAALYWHLTRRRVRARNWLRRGLADAPFAYHVWGEGLERAQPDAAEVARITARWPAVPTVCVAIVCPDGAKSDWCARALASVRGQTYGAIQSIVAGPATLDHDNDEGPPVRVLPGPAGASAAQLLAAAIAANECDYLVPVLPGTVLAASGVFRLVEALQAVSGAKMAYGDHDLANVRGERRDAWLKPVWNDDLALAQDFFSPGVLLQSTAASGWGPSAPDAPPVYDLVIDRFLPGPGGEDPVHCPHIVAHCHAHPDQVATQPARAAVVRRKLAAAGVAVHLGRNGLIDLDWPLPDVPPLVSIIVPTRDKVELLRPCIESVIGLTDYPAYEIVVVDNRSSDPDTLAYLAQIAQDPRIVVVPHDRDYNYAEINNAAAARARGEYLCLLNNDTEVIEPGWLTLMMRQAVRPGVGAVGAKLLYADRSIQHAGVVIGMGGAAGHAHRHQPDGEPGYFLQAHVQRRALAVTAACLVVGRDRFERVGGLDQATFAIAYNDVDLCLKLDAAGLVNIYEPRAMLFHHESKSRGSDFDPTQMPRYLGELAALQSRWDTRDRVDPLHHPALDRTIEQYRIDYRGISQS